MVIVLMGVTGCGKTTVGRLLAEQLGWMFYDADDFHPEENVEKMRQGIPLDDDDRLPWLQRLAELINSEHENQRNMVLACSALKRKYRDVIQHDLKPVRLVYLKGEFELIRDRLSQRVGHYMNPELLKSQFDALEEPMDNEGAVLVDISPNPEDIVTSVRTQLLT